MFVSTEPEALAATAAALNGLGTTMASSNAAMAPSTTAVAPAGADEVSALTALQFGAHGGMYQAVGAMADMVHAMFTATMGVSAGSYEATEVTNTIASA
jgi:hypothetical protein